MPLAGAHPHDAERRDIRRQTDGEGRENDVPNDGEGELQPGDEDGIEFHGINPQTRAVPCPRATLIRRALLLETARPKQAGPSQAGLRARDRDVPWPSCSRPRRSTRPRTRWEEQTSELQSRVELGCRLLFEKTEPQSAS